MQVMCVVPLQEPARKPTFHGGARTLKLLEGTVFYVGPSVAIPALWGPQQFLTRTLYADIVPYISSKARTDSGNYLGPYACCPPQDFIALLVGMLQVGSLTSHLRTAHQQRHCSKSSCAHKCLYLCIYVYTCTLAPPTPRSTFPVLFLPRVTIWSQRE